VLEAQQNLVRQRVFEGSVTLALYQQLFDLMWPSAQSASPGVAQTEDVVRSKDVFVDY